MKYPVTVQMDAEDRRWLEIARRSGFSMSNIVNRMLQPGQHCGLKGEVEWLVQRRIQNLTEAGYAFEARRLAELLEAAGSPVCYH